MKVCDICKGKFYRGISAYVDDVENPIGDFEYCRKHYNEVVSGILAAFAKPIRDKSERHGR